MWSMLWSRHGLSTQTISLITAYSVGRYTRRIIKGHVGDLSAQRGLYSHELGLRGSAAFM